MVYKSFDKKVSGSGVKSKTIPNQQLVKKLHNGIIRKFEKQKILMCRDNIWGADVADIQVISKFNRGVRFLLSVVDIYSKYAWVVPLKDKKVLQLRTLFKNF